MRDDIRGTPLYHAPEVENAEQSPTLRTVKAIDVWGLGMLLWQVIIGGGKYIDENGGEIDLERMQNLRSQGLVADTAWKSCSKFIRTHHFGEQTDLREGIQTALSMALSADPTERPEASKLLESLQQLLMQ